VIHLSAQTIAERINSLQASLPDSEDYAESLRHKLAERVKAHPPREWSSALLFAFLRLLDVLGTESPRDGRHPRLRLLR
jgi:hypothetical protein